MTHKPMCQWEKILIRYLLVTESVLGAGDILKNSTSKVPTLLEVMF